ncbi:uncharacterized protein LOC143450511 isoform X3 [Clavelina lepadiformis]|uniref:uncharacterized protein LOC143450511 isoform X3 n=1 Tax=Clavelina lepadiformis TaxID=159417 RepID=UPI004041F825
MFLARFMIAACVVLVIRADDLSSTAIAATEVEEFSYSISSTGESAIVSSTTENTSNATAIATVSPSDAEVSASSAEPPSTTFIAEVSAQTSALNSSDLSSTAIAATEVEEFSYSISSTGESAIVSSTTENTSNATAIATVSPSDAEVSASSAEPPSTTFIAEVSAQTSALNSSDLSSTAIAATEVEEFSYSISSTGESTIVSSTTENTSNATEPPSTTFIAEVSVQTSALNSSDAQSSTSTLYEEASFFSLSSGDSPTISFSTAGDTSYSTDATNMSSTNTPETFSSLTATTSSSVTPDYFNTTSPNLVNNTGGSPEITTFSDPLITSNTNTGPDINLNVTSVFSPNTNETSSSPFATANPFETSSSVTPDNFNATLPNLVNNTGGSPEITTFSDPLITSNTNLGPGINLNVTSVFSPNTNETSSSPFATSSPFETSSSVTPDNFNTTSPNFVNNTGVGVGSPEITTFSDPLITSNTNPGPDSNLNVTSVFSPNTNETFSSPFATANPFETSSSVTPDNFNTTSPNLVNNTGVVVGSPEITTFSDPLITSNTNPGPDNATNVLSTNTPATDSLTVITSSSTSYFNATSQTSDVMEVSTNVQETTAPATGSCDTQPCLYGGTCTENSPFFSCNCTQNYIGTICGTFRSPCLSSPCQNGGQCNSTSQGFECHCTPTYQGDLCETDVDECGSGSTACAANAICSNKIGGFSCECTSGYQGDGKVKCIEVVLLPYGINEGDTLLTVADDTASNPIALQYAIPFGSQTFFNIRLTSNGIIYLGTSFYWVHSLYRPSRNGFRGRSRNLALLAPFWDDFHPSFNNDGRVYFQSYDKVSNPTSSVVNTTLEEVKRRIDERFGIDFDPIFAYKATWSEVVMYPEYYQTYRDYPSTFQAVLTTDGCNTYLIYLYKEDGMLWQTGIRYTDRGLIGYTNGAELDYIETQGNYRPDQLLQTGSSRRGEFFYKLTPSSNSAVQESRCNCLKWYVADLDNYIPRTEHTCPCSSFQARLDRRFFKSVDQYLWYRGKSSSEWAPDYRFSTDCFQRRSGNGPRCCYRRRFFFFFRWWSFITSGPLVRGSFGSRSERYQIPISDQNGWIYWRDSTVLDQQYNDALNGDLIPRKQCCDDSQSPGYCRLYEKRRPAATCFSYYSCIPSFLWGDPHLTTFDGASYTFNGLGEYYMVYAPTLISIQARTKRVLKDDGTESDATGFVACVVKDHTNNSSGTVQFEVDPDESSGKGIIVKVNDVIQSTLNETETVVESLALTFSNDSYEVIFPSEQSITVTALAKILTIQFTGDPSSLQSVSKGLLGFWSGSKSDDFELRNGTVLNFNEIQVTTDLDVLDGTISERKVYPFGQSWQVPEDESLFIYTGGEDTYAAHNPVNSPDPPFLEDLVADQKGTPLFEEIRTNCTSDGDLSTACLFDTLTTNRSDIGQTTLENGFSAGMSSAINANTPPNISIAETQNFVNGFFQAQISLTTTFQITATDANGDSISYSLADTSGVTNVDITSTTGVGSWTPNSDSSSLINETLEVQAYDGTEYSVVTVPIKLCLCENNGLCLYDMTLGGSENFEIVQCECTDAYSGDYCTEDRNECDGFENGTSPCFTDVSCVDRVAPDSGYDCGDCPTGTTGDGRNCTTINLCDSNPCSQVCSPIFGGFNCSCNDGYRINDTDSTLCDDIDECMESYPCESTFNSECSNTMGNYSCQCMEGYQESGSICVNIDECSASTAACDSGSTECTDLEGTFECSCKTGFERTDPSATTTCDDINECAYTGTCVNANCVNTAGSYNCNCNEGYSVVNDQCAPDAFMVQLTVAGETFTDDLRDNQSAPYQELASRCKSTLDEAYLNKTDSTVNRFLQGSVIVIMTVNILNINDNFATITSSFNETIGSRTFTGSPKTDADAGCFACADSARCDDTNTNDPCYCNNGYTKITSGALVECIEQCQTGYCLNGAECEALDIVGYPNCKCADGFTGDRCADAVQNLAWIAGPILGGLVVVGGIMGYLWWHYRKYLRVHKHLLSD